MTVKSWSYSKLIDFEQCPYRFKLKHVDRVPEEKSDAADRGTHIHSLAEEFTNGKLKLLAPELRHFKDEFEVLRREYKAKTVSLEGEWGFNKDWEIHDYRTAWLRMKADAVMHRKDNATAIVIDFKTGKKFGNEIKHGEQVQLYALATAIREPWIKNITVELWYLDLDDITTTEYSRTQAISFLPGFEKRANKIFACKNFEPRANVFTCKWCSYGPNKQNVCEFGITGSESVASYRQRFG